MTGLAGSELTIAPMRAGDLERVVAIEAQTSACPWSMAAFRTELARADRRYLTARRGPTPSTTGGEPVLVGFAGVAFLADEAHVMTVAVDPAHRRLGVGRRLVADLLDAARSVGIVAATLEVRASNDAARRLYRHLGFGEAGVRPSYYPDGEDAVIMWHRPAVEVG